MFQTRKACDIKNVKNKKFIFKGMFGTVMVKYYTNMKIALPAKPLIYND